MSEAINTELLRKVWNMAEHGTPGERTAARARAEALVRRHGKTLADVPALLAARRAPITASSTPDQAPRDHSFRDAMRAERARMTPEQRAAAEAFEAYVDSGAMWANMKWRGLSAAQQKALQALAQPGVLARRRKRTCIFDLLDADGTLVAAKVAMEASLSTLFLDGLLDRLDGNTFRINAKAREIVDRGQQQPPPGPYDKRSRMETNQGWKSVAAWCLANGRGLSEWETNMLGQVAAAEAMPSSSRLSIVMKLRHEIERLSGRRCPYEMDEFHPASV